MATTRSCDVSQQEIRFTGQLFVKPPALGAVKRQKRSRSGSRSSSVFRGARGNDHDPAASKLAVWAESNPAHTSFSGWPTNSAAKIVDGIGGRWTALRWEPPSCTKSCNPPCPRSQEPSASLRPSWTNWRWVGRAADVAPQRYKAIEMAMRDGDWKCARTYPLLRVHGAGRPALWVPAIAKAIKHLFCAGWTGRFVASFLALLTFFQAQESCLCKWLDFILHLLESCTSSVDLAPTQAKQGSLKLG